MKRAAAAGAIALGLIIAPVAAQAGPIDLEDLAVLPIPDSIPADLNTNDFDRVAQGSAFLISGTPTTPYFNTAVASDPNTWEMVSYDVTLQVLTPGPEDGNFLLVFTSLREGPAPYPQPRVSGGFLVSSFAGDLVDGPFLVFDGKGGAGQINDNEDAPNASPGDTFPDVPDNDGPPIIPVEGGLFLGILFPSAVGVYNFSYDLVISQAMQNPTGLLQFNAGFQSAVPEPGTFALLGLSLAGLGLLRRHRS